MFQCSFLMACFTVHFYGMFHCTYLWHVSLYIFMACFTVHFYGMFQCHKNVQWSQPRRYIFLWHVSLYILWHVSLYISMTCFTVHLWHVSLYIFMACFNVHFYGKYKYGIGILIMSSTNMESAFYQCMAKSFSLQRTQLLLYLAHF